VRVKTVIPNSSIRRAVVAALAITATTAAFAQDESAGKEDDGALATVRVTAERFGATLQTTPVAVTAVSGDQLEQRGVTNVLNAAAEIPGIMITPTQGSNTSARIAMRGVNQSTAGINFDPAVGMYIDGIYQPRINGAFFEFFDIDNIEVLRGPQGTLYGRNSSAGALKIQTLRPAFEWTGKAELSGGNYNARGAKGYLSGPIVQDVLAFSVSGVLRKHDGFIYGTEYGRRIGDIDSRAERAKLLFTPGEKFEAELSVFAIQDYSEAGVPVPLQVLPGINMPEANGTFDRDYTRTEIYGPFGEGFINNTGSALNLRYKVSDAFELASITGFGNQRTYSTGSTLWVSLAQQAQKNAGVNVTAPSSNEGRTRDVYYTQEFTGTYTTDKVKGVVGLYYINEKGKSRATTAASPTIDQDRNTEAYAAFAQGTYNVGAGVGLTAGIRYTREEAEFTQFYRQLLGVSQSAAKTFTSTTPKLGINWQATPDLLTYASFTKGFKSGGFNPIPPNANTGVVGQIGAPTPYDPENVKSYELGAKWTTLGGKLRINVAAYRAEYEGMQLPVFFPGTSTIYTSNATSGVAKGVEIEPTWQLARTFQLYGNLALNSGGYTGPFICANEFGAKVDCSQNDLVGLMPTKSLLGFRYTPALPIPGQFRVNGSWAYHSSYYNNVANAGPLVRTLAASIYNLSLGWRSESMWDVNLDVRNLFDKHYSLAGLQLSDPVRAAVSAFPNSPREIILRVGVNF
jgi:iron complex outermembrane receptor protein